MLPPLAVLLLCCGNSFRATQNYNGPDGSKLVIDGNTVVDNDGVHYYVEEQGTATLESGRHDFDLQFFHKNGKLLEGGMRSGEALQCFYSLQGDGWMNNGGFTKRPIPSDLLYTHETVAGGFSKGAGPLAAINKKLVPAQLASDAASKAEVATLQAELSSVATAAMTAANQVASLQEHLLAFEQERAALNERVAELEASLQSAAVSLDASNKGLQMAQVDMEAATSKNLQQVWDT